MDRQERAEARASLARRPTVPRVQREMARALKRRPRGGSPLEGAVRKRRAWGKKDLLQRLYNLWVELKEGRRITHSPKSVKDKRVKHT